MVPRFADRLPLGWQIVATRLGTIRRPLPVSAAAILKIRGSGNETGSVRVEARTRVEPKDVDYLAATLRPTADRPIIVVAPFMSPRTQERLKAT